VVVPRALDLLAARGLTITFFVVGQDAALAANRDALALLGSSPHEIGNHSFSHEPWLHRYTTAEVESEIARAEEAIEAATGKRSRGFRGPGFSVSRAVLEVLERRGYEFDASTFPSFIGPLARAYYLATSRLDAGRRKERSALFGSFRDGLRPLAPYRWRTGNGTLVEIPVTTFPVVRVPVHLSYVLYLSSFSASAARAYFRAALVACKAAGVEPSILLHPLDFLGAGDAPDLAFFPAMRLRADVKLARVDACLGDLADAFDVVPMGQHARAAAARPGLRQVDWED
jgi:hypothetical protein